MLHVPGYEPLDAAAQRNRLARTLGRTAETWDLQAQVGPGRPSADGAVLGFAARLEGDGWVTDAEIRILPWDDLIARDLAMPLPARILQGGRALASLLRDGTLGRYRAAHWRYLAFVAMPLLQLLGALLGGLAAGLLLGGWPGLALGTAVAGGLVVLANRRAYLGHLLADWIFARDIARGTRPEVTTRIARFAAEITRARRSREVEEVVLCGHSLGMVLLSEALAASLAAEPETPRPAPRLALVGLGSSLLQVALMPQAAGLRRAVARIVAASDVTWVEYTSRRDLVAFHRADPVAMLGLAGRGPRIEHIHPRDMLHPAQWRRVRRTMLRAHRIYVTGHGRRYFYDWGLIACGPDAVAPPGHAARADGAAPSPGAP